MIGQVATRFSFSSASSHRSRAIRILLSLCLCTAALIVVISIMDALQGAQFDEIRKIRSFDLEVEGRHREEILSLLPERTVFEYGEGEALTEGGAFFVRYIDENYEGGLTLLLRSDNPLLIPYSLYMRTRTNPLSVSVLRKGKSGATVVKTLEYKVGGVFYTSLGDSFDATMLFLPVSEADDTVTFHTALKGVEKGDKEILEKAGYTVTTYMEKEKSLHSAFLLEKGMMYVVVGLLFLVISVSLCQSVRVFLSSRRREMAELEVMGLGKARIFLLVTASFLLILLLGILLGIVLGSALLPLLEYLSRTSLFLAMDLSVPWFPIVAFATLMVSLTILFVAVSEVRRRRTDIWEVLHGE